MKSYSVINRDYSVSLSINPKSLFCDKALYTPYLGKKLHPPFVEL